MYRPVSVPSLAADLCTESPTDALFGPAAKLFPLLYQSFTEHDAARYKILNKRLTSARAVSRVLCDSHLALVRREAPLLAPPVALVMSSPRNLCFTGRFRGSSCPSQLIEDSPPIHGLASPNSGGSGDRRVERTENHHLASRGAGARAGTRPRPQQQPIPQRQRDAFTADQRDEALQRLRFAPSSQASYWFRLDF